MTFQDIERCAQKSMLPDEPMDPDEELTWFRIRDLSRLWQQGRIEEYDMQKQRKKIWTEHQVMVNKRQRDSESLKRHAQMYQKIEQHVNRYRLHPSIEAADEIIRALYGMEVIRK